MLEPFLGTSEFANHGQRVVEGQRLMQAASDILLGWMRTEGIDGAQRDFYVRQLWDWKGSADIETMSPSRDDRVRARCAAGRWRAPTPARATGSPSPPTSAASDALRPRDGDVRRDLRRSERARLRRAAPSAVETGRVKADLGV